jgi:DNA-binding transcriptional ArsR family regulator
MTALADSYGGGRLSGDALLEVLNAVASPHRLRIIAALVGRRQYVSELAREIGMSRPLLHMHLRHLQAAGLVESTMELSDDGKAMNFLSLAPFAIHLTPEEIGEAVRTLTVGASGPQEPAARPSKEGNR